jgi:hypothetical protein
MKMLEREEPWTVWCGNNCYVPPPVVEERHAGALIFVVVAIVVIVIISGRYRVEQLSSRRSRRRCRSHPSEFGHGATPFVQIGHGGNQTGGRGEEHLGERHDTA